MVSTMTSAETIKIPEGYKQTEVGVVPEDWQWKLLGQLCIKIQDGNYGESYPKSGEFVEFGVPFLTSKVLGKTGKIKEEKIDFITTEKHELLAKAHLELNDVLFTNRGASVGAIGFADDRVSNGNIGPQLTLLRADSDLLISKYLFHVMKSSSVRRQILNQDSGSAMNFFGIGDTEKFKILFPPSIKEQTAIANALSDVDNLIASLETLIAKKSAIKTAAMQQLLTGKKRLPAFVKESEKQGSELDNTSETAQAVQTKQTATLNSDLYKESGEGLDLKSNQYSEVGNANNKQTAPRPGYKLTELGEIPEDWEMVPFGKIISEMRGGANLSPSDYVQDGLPVIPKSGVTWGGVLKIKEKDQQFCKAEMRNTYSSNIVDEAYTIIVLRDLVPSGPNIGLIVNIKEEKKYLLAQGVYGFKLKPEYSAAYLSQLSNSLEYRKLMKSILVGSTQVHIRSSTLKEVSLPLPPSLQEQAAIANVLSDMDTELDSLQQRLSKTQKIKQGMMQELLTGKTRLPFASDAKVSS